MTNTVGTDSLAELFALVAQLPGYYVTIERERYDRDVCRPTACLMKREALIEVDTCIAAVNANNASAAARLLLDMIRERVDVCVDTAASA